MRRVQLFEFNDHPRAPEALRELIIESLSRTLEWGRMLEGLVPEFTRFVERAGVDEVLDLGAGAGGPAKVLVEAMVRQGVRVPRFVLSDLSPHVEPWERLARRWPEQIGYVPESVDATAIAPEVAQGRARLLINVLHHLPPEVARGVFADAVAQRSPIFVSEAFGREPSQFLLNFPWWGVASLLSGPLLTRRHRLQKAALAWGAPGLTMAVSAWDGLVSTMRVYEEAELREMVASIPGAESFRWEFGRYRYPPMGRGLYFCGVPRQGAHRGRGRGHTK